MSAGGKREEDGLTAAFARGSEHVVGTGPNDEEVDVGKARKDLERRKTDGWKKTAPPLVRKRIANSDRRSRQ